MNAVKIFSGRKRDSVVWEFFRVDEEKGNAICKCGTGKNKICGKELSGINSSNAI